MEKLNSGSPPHRSSEHGGSSTRTSPDLDRNNEAGKHHDPQSQNEDRYLEDQRKGGSQREGSADLANDRKNATEAGRKGGEPTKGNPSR